MSSVFDLALPPSIPPETRMREKAKYIKPANEREIYYSGKINQPEKRFMRFHGAFPWLNESCQLCV